MSRRSPCSPPPPLPLASPPASKSKYCSLHRSSLYSLSCRLPPGYWLNACLTLPVNYCALKGNGLCLYKGRCPFRHHRRVDKRPRSYVSSGVVISMARLSTLLTLENRLRRAIGFLAMAALAASATGIAWVNQNHRHPRQPAFVFDESAKLRECPSAHLRSLPLAKSGASANASQLLKGNSAPPTFSLSNEVFADAMVGVAPEARFFVGYPLQGGANLFGSATTTLALCRRHLQRLAARVVLLPDCLDLLASVPLAIAIGSEISRAQIHADEIRVGNWRRFWQINRSQQKPLAVFSQDQITLPLRRTETFLLICTHDHRNDDTTGKRFQRHAINPLKAQDAAVIRHRRVLAKLRELRLISFVGRSDVANADSGHLRRQSKLFPQFRVVEFLQQDIITRLASEIFLCEPIAGSVKGFDRLTHSQGLFSIGKQLNLDCQFHNHFYRTICSIAQAPRHFFPAIIDEDSALRKVEGSLTPRARPAPAARPWAPRRTARSLPYEVGQ